jgi:hypothetical protein
VRTKAPSERPVCWMSKPTRSRASHCPRGTYLQRMMLLLFRHCLCLHTRPSHHSERLLLPRLPCRSCLLQNTAASPSPVLSVPLECHLCRPHHRSRHSLARLCHYGYRQYRRNRHRRKHRHKPLRPCLLRIFQCRNSQQRSPNLRSLHPYRLLNRPLHNGDKGRSPRIRLAIQWPQGGILPRAIKMYPWSRPQLRNRDRGLHHTEQGSLRILA